MDLFGLKLFSLSYLCYFQEQSLMSKESMADNMIAIRKKFEVNCFEISYMSVC